MIRTGANVIRERKKIQASNQIREGWPSFSRAGLGLGLLAGHSLTDERWLSAMRERRCHWRSVPWSRANGPWSSRGKKKLSIRSDAQSSELHSAFAPHETTKLPNYGSMGDR